MSEQDSNPSPDTFSYALHGEIHPKLQRDTRNLTEVEKEQRESMPWDQLPDETARAYSAFLLYLDLGPHERTQTKVAKIMYGTGSHRAGIDKWSIKYNWVNRAEAWDRWAAESRKKQMEDAVQESEDILLSYLPKVTMNLAKGASGEKTLGRAEMRAISDFLDRVGPAKQRRSQALQINQNLTVKAPQLPQSVEKDLGEVEDVEIIQESADALIPADLKNKKGG